MGPDAVSIGVRRVSTDLVKAEEATGDAALRVAGGTTVRAPRLARAPPR